MLSKPPRIPKDSGVYIFKDAQGRFLYVGKAANIKKRLTSYFQKNIPERVRRLREKSSRVEFETLPTEFDALVREAALIKKHRPKFNILMRDDKNYYYIECTKDAFSRIIVTHQPHGTRVIGPFTEGGSLFTILKLLRRSFPYCTCKKSHARQCINAEIGRCFGFCCEKNVPPTAEQKKQYQKSITSIRNVLSGKARSIASQLKHDMKRASKDRDFESAARARDAYLNLQSIIQHRHIIEDNNPFVLRHAKTASTLQDIFHRTRPISRIEGYDVSNISGADATASCVVFIDGKSDKSSYKRFKIRYAGISDFDMLKEAVGRRMTHAEWPLPDLMLIDGGIPQLRAVAAALRKHFKTSAWPFALAGLSKAKRASGATKRKASGEEVLHIWPSKKILLKNMPRDTMHILQAIRDESHRFAKKYHTLLRRI